MLYFKWGVVSSAKTAELLIKVYQERVSEHDKAPVVIKPKSYVRDGELKVGSRVGLECDADYILDQDDDVPLDDLMMNADSISAVYVDESHMLNKRQIEQLSEVSLHVDVYCYGLRTDFRNDLFEGAMHLLRLASRIVEVETKCHFCDQSAPFNLKLRDGRGTVSRDEPQIEEGYEELYLPVCYSCHRNCVM